MLHEPEFESPEEEAAEAETTPKRSFLGRIARVGFYGTIIGVFALAMAIQVSPGIAAQIGQHVPEPVAAAMASVTGNQDLMVSRNQGQCCSKLSRASMMMASTSSDSGCCPLSQGAAMASASEGGCCSETAALASAEGSCCSKEAALVAGEGCTGACPLSQAAGETLAAASTEPVEEAISLPAPEADGEDVVAEVIESVTEDPVTEQEVSETVTETL